MKISVVMQAYLGDYPGSRIFAREKFVRAVNSFLSQTHPEKELIIVADGCVFTKHIFELVYSSNPLIRLLCIDPKDIPRRPKTLTPDGKRYYRGAARALGVRHATGEIVTYLDSDDLILPHYLAQMHTIWKQYPERYVWANNATRIIHASMVKDFKDNVAKRVLHQKMVDLAAYGIHDDFFINLSVPHATVNCASYMLSHRRDMKVQWKDSVEVSEDVDLMQRIQETYPAGYFRIEIPGYVVCHTHTWDV